MGIEVAEPRLSVDLADRWQRGFGSLGPKGVCGVSNREKWVPCFSSCGEERHSWGALLSGTLGPCPGFENKEGELAVFDLLGSFLSDREALFSWLLFLIVSFQA